VLLYALRLSTKLNLFHGVPNSAADILPPNTSLTSQTYYGPNRASALLLVHDRRGHCWPLDRDGSAANALAAPAGQRREAARRAAC
jgi:hypothetical protein